ncbi:MAG TPA: TadE/TadG family type IV pilus assembly protein [Bacillota bacterium]|nr:TadE/TadG family type IV pilus assembly protein [Bacillota bacterium]
MRSEKGQSLVEMALILPILLLLLTGMLDFGTLIHVELVMDHAGREAARAASVGKNDLDIKQLTMNQAAGLDITQLTVMIDPDPTSRQQGTYATVTLSYPIHFFTPVIGAFFPKPYVLQNKTVMRVE